VNEATKKEVVASFPEQRADRRFIPYMAIHEFEALLFSSSAILATRLGKKESHVKAVLTACGEPEAINNHPETAPSKRLDAWSKNGKFSKTTTGMAIAREIGIDRMREKCPLFNGWIESFEAMIGEQA
jgi:hypothetical protein